VSLILRTPYPDATGTATYRAAVLAHSPILYWTLEEASGTPQDASGNGNHATGISLGTQNQTPVITTGKSVLLDGSAPATAAIYRTGGSALTAGATKLTILVWVRTGSSTGSNYGIASTRLASASDEQWALFNLGSTGIRFRIANGISYVTSAALATNTTYFVAAVYDAAEGVNKLKLYLNAGTPAAGGTSETSIPTYGTARPLYVGKMDASINALAWNGRIDEFALLPGVALSAAQISALYALGTT
jgi:hypothetical protein